MSAPDRDSDLAWIETALRDDAPQPDPAFARRLDERVASGFARPRRPPRLPRPSFGWMPALAGGAAVLLAAIVTVGLLAGGGEDGTERATPPSEDAARPQPAPAIGAPPGTAETTGRRVERSAQMTIAAAADEIQRVADGIGEAAESHGGHVVSSNVATGDDSRRGGTFVLRVPSKQLQAALADIGALGEVRSRRESSHDMTAPYRNTAKALGNALLERRATRDRLDGARGEEADRLRDRLRVLSARIGDLNGRMDDLRRRTVFSTVSVTLEEAADAGAGGAGSGPGDALDDALGILEGALGLAIRALGVALPLALVGLAGWLAAGVLRRRRREAALF